MKKYILAIDQGTTSSRSILFDRAGQMVASAQTDVCQHYPQNGWVEHDASEIFQGVRQTALQALRNANADITQVAAVGITNQRETTVVWRKSDGKPICPAIVWQCRRTSDRAAALCGGATGEMIYQKTGLKPDAYFSATKLEWILQNVPGAAAAAKRGELLFGTIDCWLLYCLTEGKVHATDFTNAARTMLFNIHTLEWDEELLALFGIPKSMLPEVRPCSGLFGYADALGASIPVTGMAGDQQASLFGQGCFEAGQVKNTYGTGCFLLMNTGRQAPRSDSGLLTTIAMAENGAVQYALEGSVFIGGAVVQWLRDELGLIENAAQSEKVALSVPDSGGVYVVPAFVGLGAPYWDMYARGAIVGLTRGSSAAHIVRAALESVAYQVEDVLSCMRQASGAAIETLKVDGGASANNFLMQFQADISNTTILRPEIIETTVRGAAFLAGLAVGFWSNRDELKDLMKTDGVFHGSMGALRSEKIDDWHRAVGRARGWACR